MAKKNPDYTDSAVNLTNSDVLKKMLSDLAEAEDLVDAQEEILQGLVKDHEAYQKKEEASKRVKEIRADIKAAIDTNGSFQDVEAGAYAVKQKRTTITYVVDKIKKTFPIYRDALITETVNEEALKGLIKGKLIEKEAADKCADFTDDYAYIIKVV